MRDPDSRDPNPMWPIRDRPIWVGWLAGALMSWAIILPFALFVVVWVVSLALLVVAFVLRDREVTHV